MYITDEGCPLVANFLKNNLNFEKINLKGNKITPNGFFNLCKALKLMKNLKEVNLNSNYLG